MLIVSGLDAQQAALSPEGRQFLGDARNELQSQMNLYALAGGDPRMSGLAPGAGFEVNLRVAEAYRQGADDLAKAPTPAGGNISPAEAAAHLRTLAPEHADHVLDGAISIAGLHHLDTTGQLSDADRATAVQHLGQGYGRYAIDATDSVRGRGSFTDPMRSLFGNKDAQQRQLDAHNIDPVLGTIEGGAEKDVSKPDRANLDYAAHVAIGRHEYTNALSMATGLAAGGLVARGAQQLGPAQVQRTLASEGPEGLIRQVTRRPPTSAGIALANPSIEARGIAGLRTLKTEPTNAIAKADAVQASVAAMGRAKAAAQNFRDNQTIASDGVKTINGWTGSVPDGYVRTSPEEVRDYSLKIGHSLQSKGAADQLHTDRGFPGMSRASDAEKQLTLAAPDHPIGVE